MSVIEHPEQPVAMPAPVVRRGEGGFSLIELMVAALVLSIASVGLAMMIGSSGNSQAIAKVRQQQSGVAEAVLEKVRTDQAWTGLKECRTSVDTGKPCTLDYMFDGTGTGAYATRDPMLRDEASQLDYTVRVTARGVDSDVDGTGAAGDLDGVRPDYYRLNVVVTQDRVPNAAPVRMTSDLNTQSKLARGTLRVQVCGVNSQHDERMAIATCPDSSSAIAPPVSFKPSSPGACWRTECRTYVCASPAYASHCAWRSGIYTSSMPAEEYVSVTAFPVVTAVRIIGADANTTGVNVTVTTDHLGVATARNLVPGRYKVEVVSPPPHHVIWESHSIPGTLTATVEPGLESRTVQMFRPKPQQFVLRIEEVDDSRWFEPTVYDTLQARSMQATLRSAPVGRTGFEMHWATAVAGASTLVFSNLSPGLYSPRVYNSPFKVENHPGFIWVAPHGGTSVPSQNVTEQMGVVRRTRCFDWYARQEAIAYATANGIPIPAKLSRCPNEPSVNGGTGGTPIVSEPAPTPPPPPPPPPPIGGGA